MTETLHTRSRRASLYGLALQVVVFAGLLGLAGVVSSAALFGLAWYVAGGVLIWFACLLVFRQRELATLEALDLEELRREKRASGGSEGMFDEQGGGALGLRVAQARLQWMLKWLIPAFGLLNAIYLGALGLYLWFGLKRMAAPAREPLVNLPIAMIVLAVVMLLLFLFSRYTSGMGRVREWQLLRACASYMLGNAAGALALILCLGVCLYAEVTTAERVLAYAFPIAMLVLAAETLVNFVLDIYRPRVADTEPRACFDSRLLGLISEPGGIASTIAEAINYQFGFQVSQTWFYQLLQRTFVPLMGFGALTLWLLTCVVIVQPGETAIIERFGAQLNADQPYGAGCYWKRPWPIDVAHKYNTGLLHQVFVGFKQFDGEPIYDPKLRESAADLWTDAKHLGQLHFDFLVPIPPGAGRGPATTQPAPDEGGRAQVEQAWPVNLARTDVAVQYKIRADKLAAYTQQTSNPEDTLREIAWEETVRYCASHDLFSLLGEKYGAAGNELTLRINQHLAALDLGLEVVYVGVQNVHPEPGVSKEFRKVVTAEQEKIAAIREALVRENQVLSATAGERGTALALAQAIADITPNTNRLDQAALVLEKADPAQLRTATERSESLKPMFTAVTRARWRLEVARQEEAEVRRGRVLDMGRSDADVTHAEELTHQAEAELAAAEQALEAAFAPLRSEWRAQLDEGTVAALRDHAQARYALAFWNARLEELLPQLQGEAAAILAGKQAERWAIEMGATLEVTRLLGERAAYRAAPRIYKIRKYLDTLVEGIRDSRKFFLAFDPGQRTVRVRFMAEEQARPEITDLNPRMPP